MDLPCQIATPNCATKFETDYVYTIHVLSIDKSMAGPGESGRNRWGNQGDRQQRQVLIPPPNYLN
jgi:hypothetical protein